METEHTETIVDKAVAYVKEMFGVQPEAAPAAEPEYEDTAPEVTAENAMRLNPDAYAANSIGPMSPDAFVPPMDDTECLRREVDEYPRQKTALELDAERARREDGG